MAMMERDDDLDGLFGEARTLRPEPGDDLMARILADADALAAERERPVPAAPAGRPARGGWLQNLGGWPMVGGLVASTLAGLWIGVAQPSALSNLASSVWDDQVSVNLGIDVDPVSLLEG